MPLIQHIIFIQIGIINTWAADGRHRVSMNERIVFACKPTEFLYEQECDVTHDGFSHLSVAPLSAARSTSAAWVLGGWVYKHLSIAASLPPLRT
jgi:hypothetical protein